MKKYLLPLILFSHLSYAQVIDTNAAVAVKPDSFMTDSRGYAGLTFTFSTDLQESTFKLLSDTCGQPSTVLFETDGSAQIKNSHEVRFDDNNFLAKVAQAICNRKNFSQTGSQNVAPGSDWVTVFYDARSDISILSSSLRVQGGVVSATIKTRDLEVGNYPASHTVETLSFKLAQCRFTVVEATKAGTREAIDPAHALRRVVMKMCEMAQF